jgi:hypothetical protein
MLNTEKEECEYAVGVREKNEERIKKVQEEAKDAKGKFKRDEKKWAKGRDKRVAGWQTFQKNIQGGKFDSKKFELHILVDVSEKYCWGEV